MRGHHSRTGHGFHGPLTGRMRGFVQPWLLLLLADSPAHGYQLLERLNQNEDTRGIDPGLLYRTLRQFEEDGLVKSSWIMKAPVLPVGSTRLRPMVSGIWMAGLSMSIISRLNSHV